MKIASEKEGFAPELVRRGVVDSLIVIPANVNHGGLNPCDIGKGLRTKTNANISTYPDFDDDITAIRCTILSKCLLPLGMGQWQWLQRVRELLCHGALVSEYLDFPKKQC